MNDGARQPVMTRIRFQRRDERACYRLRRKRGKISMLK